MTPTPTVAHVVRFCRRATVVFLAVAAYTLLVKLPPGDLSGDWLHTTLHVLTAVATAGGGWDRPRRIARPATRMLVLAYAIIGVTGWFVDGLALGTPLAIPLAPGDNVFHLTVALTGALALWADTRPPAERVST